MAACVKLLPFFALKIQFSRADFHYSELTILHTTKNHSGNYTCVPSNSQPASVVVHIFKGECIMVFIKSYRINKSKTSRKLAKFLWKVFLWALKAFYCEIFARRGWGWEALNVLKQASGWWHTSPGLKDMRKWCLHKSLLLKQPLVSEIKEN